MSAPTSVLNSDTTLHRALCFVFIVGQAQGLVGGVATQVGVGNAALDAGLDFLTIAGMYVVHFLTIMLAIFASVDTVSGEIASHTIQAIATKPVRRWEIIAGKWLGQSAMIVPYLALLTGGIVACVYFVTGYMPQNVLPVLALNILQVLVLLSLSLLGGTRLSTLTNGVVLFMLYALAFIGSWIEQIGALTGTKAAVNIGIITSLAIPVEALWRLAASLLAPFLPTLDSRMSIMFGGGSQPSLNMVIYSVAYVIVVPALAMRVFNRRDL